MSSRRLFCGLFLDLGDFSCGGSDSVSMRGIGGCLRRAFRACLSFCNLIDGISRCLHLQPHESTHFSICSSSSLIFSVFCTFLGFGFFTTTEAGCNSSRLNQSERVEFEENSFCKSSCMTRAESKVSLSNPSKFKKKERTSKVRTLVLLMKT